MSCRRSTTDSRAKIAATVTKIAMPATQKMMARIAAPSSFTFDTRAFTIAVMTRATTPSGWTTMSGAKPRLVSWNRIASPSRTLPQHPPDAGGQPQQLLDAQTLLVTRAVPRLDDLHAAVLELRSQREEDAPDQSDGDRRQAPSLR